MDPSDPVQRRCYKIKNPVDIKIYNIQIKSKKKYNKIGLSIKKIYLQLKNKNHKNIVFTVSESHFYIAPSDDI